MKNLLILFSLISFAVPAFGTDLKDILLQTQTASQGTYYYQAPTPSNMQSYRDQVRNIFRIASVYDLWAIQKIAANGGDNPYGDGTEYKPGDIEIKLAYHDLAKELLTEGKAKEADFLTFKSNYLALESLTPPSGQNPKDFWKDKYINVFNQYFNAILNSPQICAGTEVLAVTKLCCNQQTSGSTLGLMKLPFVIKKNNNGIPGGSQCSDHGECISGVCIREVNTAPGICASQNVKGSGEACNVSADCLSGYCEVDVESGDGFCTSATQCYELQEEHAQCVGQQPYCAVGRCYNIDKGSLGGNSCVKKGLQCANNNDCCSERCDNNVCVENKVCEKCVGSGATPGAGESCCPGYYLNTTTNKCNNEYNPIVPKNINVKYDQHNKNLFIKILNLIIPTAHAADTTCPDGTPLTPAQIAVLNQKESDCNSLPPNTTGDPEADKKACLLSLKDMVNGYCNDASGKLTPEQQAEIDRLREQCQADHPAGGPDLEACLKLVDMKEAEYTGENGGESTGERYGDYINQYNAPVPVAKTYSDIRSCEFHSFNDTWKDASNVERNAEIFLRSFEFVYAGEGTQDYWQDGSEGNIFKRANKVALSIRESRKKMMDQYLEIDKKMTCKCLAVFGLDKFPAAKQTYFNENCSQYRSELQSQMASEGQGSSGIDGTSINGANPGAMNDAQMETIDKGALGISYEKLLIEFTELQANSQITRFDLNAPGAEELTKLSEFIRNTDFEEFNKDTVTNGLPTNLQNNSGYDSFPLYTWGRRYPRGFWRIFAGGGGSQNADSQLSNDALKAAFGDGAEPEIHDHKETTRNIDMFTKMDGFSRYYVGPYYNNNSSDSTTKCEINAKASACLRSAYAFKPGTLKYLDGFPSEGHYIVDPKRPPFSTTAGNELIKINAMDSNSGGLTWVQIIKNAVADGKQFLMTKTRPADFPFLRRVRDRQGYSTVSKNSFYLHINSMNVALGQKHFFPLRGNYTFKDFGASYRQMLINAATKYATCKKLKDNTDRVECNGSYGANDNSIGFGYLFENETEAREWAEYTYEMHYVYSSVTSNNYIGYPLLGANYYFEAVASKISLLEGIWLNRWRDKLELVNLYKGDLEKRIGDYGALGQANDGTQSQNIRYSERVINLAGELNFSGQTNMEQFQQRVASASSGQPFSAAELSAVNAITNSAIRRNAVIKRAADFKKDNKNNKGVLAQSSNPNANNLLNPIQAIAKANSGGGFASGALGDKLDSINKQLANISKNQKIRKKPRTSPFNSNFQMPNYSPARSSYSSPETTTPKTSGMSAQETSKLLRRLKKNKDLTVRLDSDNLFTIVSKAYKRNYGRVLSRSTSSTKKITDKKTVTDKEKEELKVLLDAQ